MSQESLCIESAALIATYIYNYLARYTYVCPALIDVHNYSLTYSYTYTYSCKYSYLLLYSYY